MSGSEGGPGKRTGRKADTAPWPDPYTADIDPAPQRSTLTWSEFLRTQAAVACDFVTIDTALLRRYYSRRTSLDDCS
jgi:hypothetical protein